MSRPFARPGARVAMLVVGLAALLCVGATTVAGAPTSFELVFDGRHVPATIPSASGVMHVGPFTASPPFCPSGTVTDLEFQGSAAVTRSYTCDDGSGGIRISVTTPAVEHETGGTGRWRILDGTGEYASLRGNGTWTSARLAGDPSDFASVVFRSTSRGAVDFDADAPRIVISRASATKLRRPQGAYLARISFSARDNVPGNRVSYVLEVTAGSSVSAPLARKAGTTASGLVTLAFRIRPSKRLRRVRLEIMASDPLDNRRTLVHPLRLRRS